MSQLETELTARVKFRRAPHLQRLVKFGPRLLRVRASRELGKFGVSSAARAKTFWGASMSVRLPEVLSCELLSYGYYDADLSRIMLRCLTPGMVVYDVGAHFGYFTLLAAHLVGDGGEVHSFEPTPATFAMLTKNAGHSATLNQVAVWHEPAILTMRDFGTRLSMFNTLLGSRPAEHDDRGQPTRVEAVSLDDYANAHRVPDFVKIDAESAELYVLRGMAGLLASARPMVTVEVGDFGVAGASPSLAVLNYMINLGYEPFEVTNNDLVPHKLRSRYGYGNILLR